MEASNEALRAFAIALYADYHANRLAKSFTMLELVNITESII
jgi:hypothetical protein